MGNKYFISADIEGITDVTAWCETKEGENGYEQACAQMTREVAAACEAIIEAGGVPVVRDGHENARNISHMDLPRGTVLMRGWAYEKGSMMAGLDETFAGAIYIGYHAAAGTNGSPLSHTIENDIIRWLKINGKLASELTLNSYFAASKGVPSLVLTGDQSICEMSKEEIPSMEVVAVKKCVGNSTYNMHPLDAVNEIKKTVAKQIAKFEAAPWKPQPLPEKFEIEVCLQTHQMAKYADKLSFVTIGEDNIARCTASSSEEMNVMIERIMG